MKKQAGCFIRWIKDEPKQEHWTGEKDYYQYPFIGGIEDTPLRVCGELYVGSDWDYSEDVDEDGRTLYDWHFDQAWVDMEIGVQDEEDLYYERRQRHRQHSI